MKNYPFKKDLLSQKVTSGLILIAEIFVIIFLLFVIVNGITTHNNKDLQNIPELLNQISVRIMVTDITKFRFSSYSGVAVVSTSTNTFILSTFHKKLEGIRIIYVISQGKIYEASVVKENYTNPNFVLLKTPSLPIKDIVLPFGKPEVGMKLYYRSYSHGVEKDDEGEIIKVEGELRMRGYARFGSSGAGAINEKGELIGLIETTNLANESRLVPSVDIFKYLWSKNILIWKMNKGERV